MKFRCSLVCALLALTAWFIGCSENSSEVSTPTVLPTIVTNISADKGGGGPSLGELHNAILNDLDQRHVLFGDGKYAETDSFLTDMQKSITTVLDYYNINETVTEADIWEAVCVLDSLKTAGLIDVFSDPPEITDYQALHSSWVTAGYITANQANWLNHLVAALLSATAPDDVPGIITQHCLLWGNPIPGSNVANYFDILKSSNEYWGSTAKIPWWAIGEILADAAGGIIGGVTGPIGAVIIGASASVAVVISEPEGG